MYVEQLASGHWRALVKVSGVRKSVTRPTRDEALRAGDSLEMSIRAAGGAPPCPHCGLPLMGADASALARSEERARAKIAARGRSRSRRRVRVRRHTARTEQVGPQRFALAPLASAIGGASLRELGRRLDVSPTTVHRAERAGLSPWTADRWAIAVGLHPANVWPDWVARRSGGAVLRSGDQRGTRRPTP